MSTEIVRANAVLPAQSLDASVRFAQLLADADLLPKQFVGKPANVLYAVEYGRTLGIAPVAAITGIHVIEGKPSASSGLIGGLVRQAGHKLRVRGNDQEAVAQIIRADDPDWTYECTWTLERAAQAGLCKLVNGKPVARDYKDRPTAWEKYPAAMLKARAITEVARDACEDVLFGLHYTPEELGAVVNQDGEPMDATVQQLRSVPTKESDQWQQPVPAQQTPPEVVARAVADVPAESLTPAGRDYLHEAHAAPDANTVRQIWQDAKAEGARDGYLAQIAEVGRQKAAAEAAPVADEDVVDGEIVPDEPLDEHAAAVAELRAYAASVGLDDIDRDAHGALGVPLAEAAPSAIRNLLGQLRGNAA
jgi:hypothetical protein